jgi:DNA polymerase
LKKLEIDIETFSSADLKKSGMYKYAEAADFEILLFAYAVDGGEVTVVDLAAGETIPQKILDALTDDNVQKWAHNAAFERVCLSRYLRDMGISLDPFADYHHSAAVLGLAQFLNPEAWRCSMVWAAYMGMPLALESVGAVLGLEQQKLSSGKDLIRYFCKPCKPTKANGERTRNLPEHAPEKWTAFKEYNAQDVTVEMAIQARLAKFPVPDSVWAEYCQDQEINDRGVALDMDFVKKAIAVDKYSQTALLRKMREITGLDNPNSVAQLSVWFAENGLKLESLDKAAVADALTAEPTEPLKTVLLLRQQLAKSSVKKYQAMESVVCADGRARGMFQFLGANRTGRWAGRLIQLQNVPQNNLKDLEGARELVKQGNFPALDMLYDSVPNVLSELIRTAFVPKSGCKLIVADFAAIERVVLAWFAKERWVLDAYNAKKDLYIATASQMFNIPMEQIDKKDPLRQRGKTADLACGYGGSVGAMINMGALEQGLTEDELQPLVNAWRTANPKIVQFWYAVERAVMEAVSDRTTTQTHGLKFTCQSGMLFITLPSGRRLAYVKPRIGINRFDRECVEYMGVGDNKKWERIQSYGAKFVENIVQAASRDLLANAMQTLRHCEIVAHIHDEVVLECDPRVSLEVICQQMSRSPAWADGLTVRVEGFETQFYKKD